MNYYFTGLLIVMLVTLALCGGPGVQQTTQHRRRGTCADADEDGCQSDRTRRNGRVRLYGADCEAGIVRDIT